MVIIWVNDINIWLGTLHEFTIAMETGTPIGFLQGGGGVSSQIEYILKAAGEESSKLVIFESDPNVLIAKITKKLDEANKQYRQLYQS